MTQHGACLCGEINYRLNSEIMRVVNCHCNFCRSHSGSAFATYAALPHASLEISKGQEKLGSFDTGNGRKHFCSVCGTPIFNLNNRYPGACMIYLGTLENAREITPAINIWCESKLGWVDTLASIDSLAQGVASNNT